VVVHERPVPWIFDDDAAWRWGRVERRIASFPARRRPVTLFRMFEEVARAAVREPPGRGDLHYFLKKNAGRRSGLEILDAKANRVTHDDEQKEEKKNGRRDEEEGDYWRRKGKQSATGAGACTASSGMRYDGAEIVKKVKLDGGSRSRAAGQHGTTRSS